MSANCEGECHETDKRSLGKLSQLVKMGQHGSCYLPRDVNVCVKFVSTLTFNTWK